MFQVILDPGHGGHDVGASRGKIRESDIALSVAKKINSEQLFTGKIPLDNIDVALQIVASSYHLKYSKSNKTTYNLEEIR